MIGARGLFALVVAPAGAPAVAAFANVVTDWDEIGVKTVQPIGLPLPIKPGLLFRAMAMMHLAMFNAVNAIEPRYQGYKFQSKAELGASEDAAASAAANVYVTEILSEACRAGYGPAQGLPDTKVGTFPQALYDEAKRDGWFVISMKDDWKRIFAFEG